MRVCVDGDWRSGRALDLSRFDLSPDAVADAVRNADEESRLTVRCPDAGPVHAHVGCVTSDVSLRTHTALAAAARSRGVVAPQDDEIAAIDARLAEFDVPDVSLRSARQRVADASGRETELRERVATLRGRVKALREIGADATDAEDALTTATRQLSEAETERIAAEQALDRARDRAATARDRRAERLRLRDRKANRERNARRHLAEEIHDEFAAAVTAVPGDGTVGSDAGEFDGDAVTAALAVARVADLAAPVVVALDRFESAVAAADCLDAPVLYV